MRDQRAERLCLLLGSALLLAAVCLYVHSLLEDARAGAQAASAVSRLRQSQSRSAAPEPEQPPAGSALAPQGPEPAAGALPGEERPEAEEPREYLGILTIPALGLELPVQSQWSREGLKVSPCRQCGSVEGGDLVIAAHNYRSHFGRLHSLTPGDEVRFAAQDGTEAVYTVERLAQLSPAQPEAVRQGGCPLVLYTCTPGGGARVAVYCRQK